MAAASRTYGDRCGVARALDAVGERWSLLVVRELLLGPKRFTDLRAGLPGVSADVLAQRLRDLEAAGLLSREILPPPAASRVYALTPRGEALEPVVLALGRWGSVAPQPAGDARLGADALVVALRTLFDPALAAGNDARCELRLDGTTFTAEIRDGRLETNRGPSGRPDAVIEGTPGAVAGVLWHGRPFTGEGAEVTVTGSRAAARRFSRLFPLPAGTPAPA